MTGNASIAGLVGTAGNNASPPIVKTTGQLWPTKKG